MGRAFLRWGLALVVVGLWTALITTPASLAAYEFDPVLSLTGDCSTSKTDPVPDPGCPAPPRPSARFDEPDAVGVDSHGDIYVASYVHEKSGVPAGSEGRIDIFDDEGFFLSELADPHGPKSIAIDSEGNLYVFEAAGALLGVVARYPPTVYNPEQGEIEYAGTDREVVFEEEGTGIRLAGLAIDAKDDRLFLAFFNSIKEFSSAKEGNELKATITSSSPKLSSSTWVAVDAKRRRLYASSCQGPLGIEDCGILVFNADAPHELLKEIDGSTTPEGEFRSEKGWLSVAVDEETGHLFVAENEAATRVYEFGENYEYLATIAFSKIQLGNPFQIAGSNAESAADDQYLFVPSRAASGSLFAFKPNEVGPPQVEGAAVPDIGETEAELEALVDPDGAVTEYVFEYVSQQDFELEGFDNPQIAGGGTIPVQSLPRRVTIGLNGLSSGSAYRFRIVATNAEGSDQKESSFSTYADASTSSGSCPNSASRTGPSLLLPDCRAYELVTPADTNGRPPKGIGYGEDGFPFPTYQASPSGEAVSFMTEGGGLPGTEGTGGFGGDPYRATRSASGWSTVATGPNGTETNELLPGSPSPDQGYLFWSGGGEGSAVIEGRRTGYVHYPDGHSELIGQGSLGSDPGARGKLITENGTHIIFATRNTGGTPPEPAPQLEPDAPPTGTAAVYDRTSDGVTHVVSLLPVNVTPGAGQDALYQGASPDGAGIAFSIGNTLYLRLNDAVTYEIGRNVLLAGISNGGRRVFYVEGGDLFAFDTETESVISFASTGNAVVVNVAADGSRAYFVSTTAIAEAGENPNFALPQTGQQNLYLSEEGLIRFVGTVTDRDVEGEVNALNAKVDGLGLWTESAPGTPPVFASQPGKDPSRLTPDGTVMVFESRADLDGSSPNSSRQIYRYDSVGNRLHCISCNPTNPLATGGGASLETIGEGQTTPPPFSSFGFVPNLRPDGRRAFFESKEPLVAADTDGVQDIYEWGEQGVGSCTRAGGCVYLISSGHTVGNNYLFGAGRSGDDVFFVTADVLVPADNDALSIYDARVNGGFPPSASRVCEGEGCRPGMTAPPQLPAPAKPATGADDNVRRKRCPRGKHRAKRHGKVRCVKERHHKHHRHRTRKGAAK